MKQRTLDLTIFKRRFQELKKERSTSNYAISKTLNISDSAISAWELSKKMPSIESLYKLADFFNVSIDYLVGRTDT